MSIELGRLLIDAGVVSPADVEAALFVSFVRGIPFPRALLDRARITERALEEQLERRGGLSLRQVLGSRELFARLPRALCRRLGAVPTRLDPGAGAVEVAAADPLDRHVPAELSFHLGQPVRVVRASMSAIEDAIRALELDDQASWSEPPPERPRERRATPASPHGAPQSSIPPPPEEDVPIPLLKRASVPVFDAADLEGAPGGSADVVLPLRQTKPARAEPRAPREAERALPVVSFPSWPPFTDEAPPAAPDAGSGDRTPATLRHGRLHTARPEIRVAIPPPRADQVDPPAPPPAPAAPALADTERPPPFADLSGILGALGAARSRDEIVTVALRGLRLLARRVGLFIVKRGAFHGYTCSPELAGAEAFREITIPVDQPSILATAAATSLYLGPVPGTLAHAPLLDVMRSTSPDVAAIAVRVAGRPVLVMLADELADTMRGTRSMDELARAVGDALTRILAARH